MSLEYFAMSWLRFEKRCPIVLRERTPLSGMGNPDVLGVTAARELLEIEIKRSVSDFKANAAKYHIQAHEALLKREVQNPRWPKNFWFLVPWQIVDKVMPLLPDYAGLLRGPTNMEVQQPVCVVKSPTNRAHEKLKIKACLRLGQLMANQIISYERARFFATMRARLTEEPEYSI